MTEWWHLAVVVVAMAAFAVFLIWGSCAHSGWLDGAKCCDGDWLTTAELIRYGCPDD